MGWAQRDGKKNRLSKWVPEELREFLQYATRSASTAATALSYPYAVIAILFGAVFPSFWSVMSVVRSALLPLLVWGIVSGVMIVWFRRKKVGLGPATLYLLGNAFLTFYFCGWLAWALDFSAPRVYRVPLRGRQDFSGVTFDFRPITSHLFSLTGGGCRISIPVFPFDLERGEALSTTLGPSICHELPASLGSLLYVEEGDGILGTGWWRLAGEEPRSVERGARLEDYESWLNALEIRRTQEKMSSEAEEKRQSRESLAKFEKKFGKSKSVVVLSSWPLLNDLSSAQRAQLEKTAEMEAAMLSECTGARLKVGHDAYPPGLNVYRVLGSAKAAEAWLLKARKCAPGAEIRSLVIMGSESP